MQLKDYQEKAIEKLLEGAKKLLGYSGEKRLVFKSPTGSGKTIMMAEFLKQLVDDRDVKQPLSFIWAVPRPTLMNQSKDKLELYFERSQALKCSFFEDLDDRKIAQNEILFLNWESINKVDNVLIRDNEQGSSLSEIIERTKEEEREIVLIIDEVHHHSESDISQGLIEMMGPKLTIGVSATPKMSNPDDSVNVQLEDVRLEGMIKKAVLLNLGFENIKNGGKIHSKLSQGTEELVIDTALKKRKELADIYAKEGNINPLVLIQLPNRIGQLEDRMKEKIVSILKDRYRIAEENGKLAIWISGEHINKDNVEKTDSEVEVLIFKQAIALGWDCPRAQILVLFREWHSPIFSIQTVGRIMRMPEPDKGHYPTDPLNYGYVYTNLGQIEILEDIAKNYITIYTSHRGKSYKPINLLSCHSIRQREKTRLDTQFINIFLQEANRYELEKKIDPKSRQIDVGIIADKKVEDIDKIGEIFTANLAIKGGSSDYQKLFDFFVREHLAPFYPEDRSVNRVKEAIYHFFGRDLAMYYEESQDEIIQIALGESNIRHFTNVIDMSKTEYQEYAKKRRPELAFDKNWNPPESERFNENYAKDDKKKCIMEPFYSDGRWQTEGHFIEFLEKSNSVEWWFKNSDRDAVYFAVPYESGGIKKPFYVDFIVKMKDGKIGLFDPHGLHLADAKPKAEGLYNYIQQENKNGKKLFGGIVANNKDDYSGTWWYFDKPVKELRDNLSNWEILEI